MDDFQMAWPFLIPIVGTICTFAFVIVLTLSRARVRELEVRERIAMIERGLVPPPEVDPRGFDRAMHRYDRLRYRSPGRHRRAGVTLMGVGFGLVMLIGVAGDSMNEGIGVGGFFVIIGPRLLHQQPVRSSARRVPAGADAACARQFRSHRPGAAAPRLARRVSRTIQRRHPYRYTPSRRYNGW